MDDLLKIFGCQERLDFGNGAKLEEAGFNYCIDLCVKFKGRIEYHTKVFDLGLLLLLLLLLRGDKVLAEPLSYCTVRDRYVLIDSRI